MTEFFQEQFGILPSSEVSESFDRLFTELSRHKGEKRLTLKKGTYYIDAPKCQKRMLYITNTVGDEEFAKDEVPHLQAVALYLENIDDFTLDGGGSTIVINGKATNMAIIGCNNITIKNLEIRHSHPDMHELKVVKKGLFSVDYEIDKDTLYSFKGNKLYFHGEDYSVRADKDAARAWWIGLIRKNTPDKVERTYHPLVRCLKISDLGDGKIRAFYPFSGPFKVGDIYYIYDVRRAFAGISLQRSKNVIFENISQRFNYSLAVVAQDCENLTIKDSDFSPGKDNPRKITSVADFVQISMCRGNITICNNSFVGAGDDCLNVHGIHFKISHKDENQLTLTFMHPQTHGFNPLRVGDTLACIDPKSLLELGKGKILNSELKDEYNIVVTVDDADTFNEGCVIENISACPDLLFKNNKVSRIITRGILITTRGKVIVEDNVFTSNTMSGILLSDDAESWYESGMCCDVTIKNNRFLYCGETPILIKPENHLHKGAVHRNIRIIGNLFDKYEGNAVYAKSTDSLLIKENNFGKKDFLQTENCTDVMVENNS